MDDVELEAICYKDLMERIDTTLIESRSYKQILSFGDWGWSNKNTYVYTSKKLETDKRYISITYDSPFDFIANLKALNSNKDIWLLGGAWIAQSFTQEGLIDEFMCLKR